MTSPHPSPYVELWAQGDEFWRWRYVEPGPDGRSPVTLLSNKEYDSREEARATALAAYPGLPVHDVDRPGGEPVAAPGRRDGRRRRLRRLLLLGLAVLLLLRLRRTRFLRSARQAGR